MAQRFQRPIPQFYDDAGNAREGARLFFYQSGTSTKLDTYKDSALGSLNTNPIVLNEDGEPDFSIFLKNQDYKVVLADVDDAGTDDPPTNVIKTWDPVRGTDFSIMPKWTAISGTPNGALAGTAGSSGVLPDKAWDYTNNIEYTCTTTGTSLSAVWTALNSTSNAAFFAPAGRLTPTSGTPIITTDAVSATAVYYTPFLGNAVPIYNGATFVMTTFTELTLTLHSSHAINTLYDIFIFNNSGVLTLATGPAWSVSTAGSGDRGTGAGTTQLATVLGFRTNAVSMTGRNGGTTYTIGANLGLCLGTMLIDGTAGQITCHRSYGTSRKFGLVNAFNQRPIILKGGDATASWTYNTATVRAANNTSANKLSVLQWIAEHDFDISLLQRHGGPTSGAPQIGIGVNSTTAISGTLGTQTATNSSLELTGTARYSAAPTLGLMDFTALEKGAGATTTFYGSETNMQLAARIWV